MQKLILAAIIAALSLTAFAQDKPQAQAADKPVAATDNKKEPPATAVIPAETVKQIQEQAKDADYAATRAENLKLKIEMAQTEFKKLNDEAEKAKADLNTAFQRAAIKAGIPGDAIKDYSSEPQQDGSLKLTRRPQTSTAAPTAPKP